MVLKQLSPFTHFSLLYFSLISVIQQKLEGGGVRKKNTKHTEKSNRVKKKQKISQKKEERKRDKRKKERKKERIENRKQ